MLINLRNLLKRVQILPSYFAELCKPNPVYIPDKMQQEFAHKRNIAFLLNEAFMITIFIFNILTGNGPFMYNAQGVIGCFGIVFVFFVSCKYHPQVFKVFFNLVLLLYGPHLIYHCEEGVLGAWIAVQSHPTLVYLVTGSIYHFIFHSAVLTLVSNTFYQNMLAKSVASLTPPSFVNSMTYYSHQTTLYSLAFTILTHKILQNAYHHITVVDKKKEDFERQKNFILGFSHELRNIINSMMGNIKLASLEATNEKIKELIKNAEICSEVLIHLVNNILDSGKLEIGDLEITPAPTKTYEIMEQIWSICSELIKRKNLIGRMKIQKDIPQALMIDHYRLTQIILNLVGNAIKFTDVGAIDISIEWLPHQFTVIEKCFEPYPFNDENDQDEGLFEKSQALSVFNQDVLVLNSLYRKIDKSVLKKPRDDRGILKITVSDTGVGMAKESMRKLFRRFSQVTQNESKKKLGTGLGLFITKQLCQGMNGEIRVFSKVDKGSAFTLCLPVDPVVDEEVSPLLNIDHSRKLISQKRLRALIVDDEHFSRVILTSFITRLDINIVGTLENGLQGFEKFTKLASLREHVNIVTMDLDMPIMGGKAAAEKIREYEAQHNLPPCVLIIISGNCSESEITECVRKDGKIRANAFLKKPVNLEELTQAVVFNYAYAYSRQMSV